MPGKTDLINLLSPFSYQWIEIGESLKIPYRDLKDLQYSSSSDSSKLSKLLQKWIDMRCSPVTWQTIIDVVGNQPVNNEALAKKIRLFLSEPDV